MHFYQLILWTYLLLPTISLLLSPTAILALARAQQQRAKIMANALATRARTAAAVARNHQRRFAPNNFNGLRKPFMLRATRQSEFNGMNEVPMTNFDHPSTIAEQNQNPMLQSINLPMNSNSPIISHSFDHSQAIEEAPQQNKPSAMQSFAENQGMKNPNGDGHDLIDTNRRILDEINLDHDQLQRINEMVAAKAHWDQQEESMGQLQNMWNMNAFGNMPNDGILRADERFHESGGLMPNFDEKSADPDPHHHSQVAHKKFNKKHEKGGSDYLYSSNYYERNNHNSDDEINQDHQMEDIRKMEVPKNDLTPEVIQFNVEGRSADPEPHLHHKKLGKKLGKDESDHYYPSGYYGGYSYYGRSNQNEDGQEDQHSHKEEVAQVSDFRIQDSEELQTLQQNLEVKSANPEPHLHHKKFSKKHKKDESNHYYPSGYYGGYSYYGRRNQNEDEDNQKSISRHPMLEESLNSKTQASVEPSFLQQNLEEEKLAYPEPPQNRNSDNNHRAVHDINLGCELFDHSEEKGHKKHETNSYYPSGQYGNYYRSNGKNEDDQGNQDRQKDVSRHQMEELKNQGQTSGNPQELQQDVKVTLANPEPHLHHKKFGKKFGKDEPEHYHPSGYYGGYYGRNNQNEDNDESEHVAAQGSMESPVMQDNTQEKSAISEDDNHLGCELFDSSDEKSANPHLHHKKSKNKKHDSPQSYPFYAPYPTYSSYPSYDSYSYYGRNVKKDDKELENENKGSVEDDETNPTQNVDAEQNSSEDDKEEQTGIINQSTSSHSDQKSADPDPEAHLHSHGFSHTHTHTHFHQKDYSKLHGNQYLPTLNHGVHVSQNQNSYVIPAVIQHQNGYSGSGISHATANSFASNGFGHSAATAHAQTNNFGQGGGIVPGFGSSSAQSSQVFGSGNNVHQNQHTGGLSSNQQGSFISGNGNTLYQSQLVGNPNQPGEVFVTPHNLDEIPAREVIEGNEFDAPRFTRSELIQDNDSEGLSLASGIVDTSLSSNPFLEEGNRQGDIKETQKTMEFITNIVDASLKAGENTNLEQKTHLVTSNEDAKNAAFREISSITDLVAKGLRHKRNIKDVETNAFLDKDVLDTPSQISDVKQMMDVTDDGFGKNRNVNKAYLETHFQDKFKETTKLPKTHNKQNADFFLEMQNPDELTTIVPNESIMSTTVTEESPQRGNLKNSFLGLENIHVLPTIKPKDGVGKEINEENVLPMSTPKENSGIFLGLQNLEENMTTDFGNLPETTTPAMIETEKDQASTYLKMQNPDELTTLYPNSSPTIDETTDIIDNNKKSTKKSNESNNSFSEMSILDPYFMSIATEKYYDSPPTSKKHKDSLLGMQNPEKIINIQYQNKQIKHIQNIETPEQQTELPRENTFLGENITNSSMSPIKDSSSFNSTNIAGKSENQTFVETLGSTVSNSTKPRFNLTGKYFDSIEEEMQVLTDQQKEEFVNQEMKLITEVLEETMKLDPMFGEVWKQKMEEERRKLAKNESESNSTNAKEVVSSPNLLQVRARGNYYDEYLRSARSTDASKEEFDSILGQHREKIDSLKEDATGDDDLLMISYIGDSVIKDLENRRNQKSDTRKKREIAGFNPNRIPLTRLISDPTTKLDVPKTLKNIGAVARHTFENSRAPMYHVRNMLGNAKNTVMSTLKVPPNNILVPSKYEVTKLSGNKDENVGEINQKLLEERSGGRTQNGEDQFGIMDTFQKIGGIVRESVNTGKDTVVHANDAATDARSVLFTARHAAPRLIVPSELPVITRDTNSHPLGKKAVLITPRLFDVSENTVGTEQEQVPNFVSMGHILDAVGISKPDEPKVELEKIVLDPLALDVMKTWDMPKELRSSSAIKSWVKNNIKTDKKRNSVLGSERNTIGDTLLTLNEAERSLGARSLKEFLARMKDEMKEIVKSERIERKRKRKEKQQKAKELKLKEAKTRKGEQTKPILNQGPKIPKKNLQSQHGIVGLPVQSPSISEDVNKHVDFIDKNSIDDEKVEFYLSPELMRPFMGQPSSSQLHDYMRENGDDLESTERKSSDSSDKNKRGKKVKKVVHGSDLSFSKHKKSFGKQGKSFGEQGMGHEDLGHVLGAINPMMFERYFNESLKHNETEKSEDPHAVFSQQKHENNDNRTQDSVDPRSQVIITEHPVKEETTPTLLSLVEDNKNHTEASNSTSRTSMKIIDQYQKPFMGSVSKDRVHSFLDQYNVNNAEAEDKYHPVKDVVYSENNDNDDEDYNVGFNGFNL